MTRSLPADRRHHRALAGSRCSALGAGLGADRRRAQEEGHDQRRPARRLPALRHRDAQNNPDGYDADVAKLFAKDLGVKLNLVPVTGPNRIPFLLTNKVDVLIASLAVTPERAKQVQFSRPYSAATIVLYAPKKATSRGRPT